MDQGGELYQNPEVRDLFEHFGYEIRPTGADASNQNGPVERSHLTVANAIRAMLLGANLDVRFWPYAFHHYIRIKNSTPSRGHTKSPMEATTGKQDDFSNFRTFGCRVWVRPTTPRRAKLIPNSIKGIFLGFIPNTDKNIMWFDPDTDRLKIAKHARFDEGMNDLPLDAIPPNVHHLIRCDGGTRLVEEPKESTIPEFTSHLNPYSHTMSGVCTVGRWKEPNDRENKNSFYGITVDRDELTNRAYVSDIARNSPILRSVNKSLIRNSHIVRINDEVIFTQEQAIDALRRLIKEKAEDFEIEWVADTRPTAKEKRAAAKEHDRYRLFTPDLESNHVPTISVADCRAIAAVRFPHLDFSDRTLSTEEIGIAINALSSTTTIQRSYKITYGSYYRQAR